VEDGFGFGLQQNCLARPPQTMWFDPIEVAIKLAFFGAILVKTIGM